MASAEEALYARMSGYAGLTALVSTRVYPVKLPQDCTYPAVTYQRISTIREVAHGADPGIARTRLQVTSAATTYSGVKAVTAQVRAALQRYDDAAASVAVLDTFLENEVDLFSEEEDDAGVYLVAQDFTVIHRES